MFNYYTFNLTAFNIGPTDIEIIGNGNIFSSFSVSTTALFLFKTLYILAENRYIFWKPLITNKYTIVEFAGVSYLTNKHESVVSFNK